MSTRANIIIKDDINELIFYRHSDGYPSETGESLKKFVKGYATKYRDNADQSAGWLIIHGREEYAEYNDTPGYQWKVGAYEPTSELHSDVEYVYIIDLNYGILECRKTMGGFWDSPTLEYTKPCEDFPSVHFKVSS